MSDLRGGLARIAGRLRKHWLPVLAFVALAVVVLAVNPVDLAHVLARTRLVPFLVMIPTTLAIYVVRSLGWWRALRRLGVRIGFGRTLLVMIAGQAAVLLPAGDLGRVALLERTGASGRDAGQVAGTVAFQELVYMGIMGLPLIAAIPKFPVALPLLIVLAVVEACIFTVIGYLPLYRWAVGVVERVKVLRRFDRELRHIRPALLDMLNPGTFAAVAGANAGGVLLMFVLFELALQAVGVQGITFDKAAFIYALSHLLAGLTFLPGGIGAYEGLLTGFMAMQGVPPSQGAAAALLYRGLNDVMMALLGIAATAALKRIYMDEPHDADKPKGRPEPMREAG